MSKKDLPSVNDFSEDNSELPSINDYLAEEVNENLPSAEDFIEKEELVEETQTIEDLNGEPFAEIEDIVPPWPELLRLINNVREEIPDIPEIKYYDKELEQLVEEIARVREDIPEVPEVRYYEAEIEAICEQIDSVKENLSKFVSDLPEVKYYDEQIESIENRLDSINQNVSELPEPKYYEEDLQALKEDIEKVRSEIPVFPKWVNEVNEVPDFSWIGKTFSVIDDDFVKVHDAVEGLRGKVEYDLDQIAEHFDKKEFETRTDLNQLRESINTRFDAEKEKIWKEIKETSMRMWGHHKEFKDDDRKLKKQILGEYNLLKQNIKKELKEATDESVKTDELLLKYFSDLKTEISELPEVKYYDDDIKNVKTDIKELFNLVKLIKSEQKELQEGLLNEPPSEKESVGKQPDPLTPMDQKFATLDDLAGHYRLFINRIQQQISTIGGGGAGFIKDLDDVTFDAGIGTNKLLIYNGTKWVGIASTAIGNIGIQSAGSLIKEGVKTLNFIGLGNTFKVNGDVVDISISGNTGAGGTWGIDSVGIHTIKSIGIGTTTAKSGVTLFVQGDAEFTGNISVAGTISYDDVVNVDSIGVITARSDIQVGGGLSVTGISTLSTTIVGTAITLNGTGINATGVITATTFSGSGSLLTNIPNTSLDNSTISYGGVQLSLGDSDSTPAFDLSDATNYPYSSLTGITTSIVGDTTPQLGGDLDLNNNNITGTGDVNITGIITATLFSGDGSGLTGVASTDNIVTDTPAIFNNQVTISDLSVTGITTLGSSNGIGTVTVGVGTTALLVDGNARVLGILTVGRGSVTIDGDNNTVTSGIVTITNSNIIIGDNVTISGNALGINSAPNVLYVAKDGNDLHNGTSIDNAKLTIASAVGIATTGTIIKVLAGNYAENNPIEVPAFVSVVGDDLKTVTVTPNTATKDIFHVRKGCYIANMTFTNHIAPSAAIGFPTTELAANIGGGKWESPYIQNCTSNTTTGTGLRVDGAQAEGLKSIVCDSYTQYNQGGVGVAITNQGFAQLVSVFTICCNEAISCHKGGQADLTNSNSSFGTFGLVSDGVSDLQFSGIVTSSAAASQDNVIVAITTTTRPYDGQLVYFDKLYQSVDTIAVSAGGTGYTSTPSVTIDAPTGPNGETATAFATIENGSVSEITIISSGSQYESAPTITIGSPNVGSNNATATASMSPIYYTINSSTPVTAGITTLTLDENLINTVGVGSTAYFHQVSRIVASSHTFEYVGSGNDITSATPKRGGVTIQANEVSTTNGGRVVYTSTDQAGNFRIGDELQINQNTGTISGRAFTKSLFSEMTPFILALS